MPSASSAGMSVTGSALGAPCQAAQAVSLPAAQEFSLLILLCRLLQVAFSQHALNSVHRRSALVPGGPPLCLCIGASKAPTWPFSGWGGWPAIPGPQCWGRTSGTGLLCMRTTDPCSSARAAAWDLGGAGLPVDTTGAAPPVPLPPGPPAAATAVLLQPQHQLCRVSFLCPAAVHLLKFCPPVICCCLSSVSPCSRRQQDEHTFHLPSAGRPPTWVFTLFKLPSQLCWWVWFRVVEKWQSQFLCLVVDMHWRHDVTEALSSPPLSVRSCEGSKH